jgi:hypothetical protein
MDVITIESDAYKDLVKRIDRIATYVVKKDLPKVDEESDPWMTTEEVLDLLKISSRTLLRLRKENLISYSLLKGRCRYRMSEIERMLSEKLIICSPKTLEEFRQNYLKNIK